MGSPAPEEWREVGRLKLTWDPDIVWYDALRDGPGVLEDYASWSKVGSPTPEVRAMLPGDSVCWESDHVTIRYDGVSFSGPLTYAQWLAAGRPLPGSDCEPEGTAVGE